MSIQSHLYFATCKVGAESALKAEFSRLRPSWRSAFSRPGFVSYKLPSPAGLDLRIEAMFAHAHGFSISRTTAAEAGPQTLTFLDSLKLATPPRLHCFARQVSETGELNNPMEAVAAAIRSDLQASGRFQISPVVAAGDIIIDVLVIDVDSVVIGLHAHHNAHSPYHGGIPPLEMPSDCPSRAWLKFEEAMVWHWQKVSAGQIAVEIGSAPGGTAFALGARGAIVHAVDPASMVPGLNVIHHRKLAADLQPGELPKSIDWLLIDINDNPGATVRLAIKLIANSARRPSLILTLKMSEWSMAADVPKYIARLRRLGYPLVRARQLTYGRREIVLLA